MRTVLRPMLIVLAVGVLVATLLWSVQRRLIYFPDRSAPPPAGTVLPGARDVAIDTSDGLRLTAWLVPPPAADRRMAVLVAPGNGGNRAGRAPLARALAAEGLTVLLLDYRGYGGNPGSPTEAGLARDVRAGRDALRRETGLPDDRILYFGESLGAAVVAELATEHPPAGLVLRSPFVDLAAVGREHYPFLPVRALLRDRYPVAEHVARVAAPTVVVYGTADSIVPARQSEQVAQRAAGEVRTAAVAGADHNDLVLLAGAPLVDAVVALADRVAGDR
jgi:hypothetical protein